MELSTNNYDINEVYKDLDLSLPIHPLTGNIKTIQGIKAVNKSIKNLILTAKWDIPFNPNLYSGVTEMLFESPSPVYFAHMSAKIRDLLSVHEPRIKVKDIDISFSQEMQAVTISIVYEVIAVDIQVKTSIVLKRDR